MPTIPEDAVQAGLQTHYHDAFGQEVQVADETLRLILAALHVETPPAGLTPPCHIATAGNVIELPLANTIGCAWRLTLEDGNSFDGGIAPGLARLALPGDLPLGYHRLMVEQGGAQSETTIIVTPARAYQPWDQDSSLKVWGLSAQLYGLRSGRNWGIGDFSDLAQLVKGAGRLGAAFVGINPLHALFPDEPENASPYSPSSRQYLNWLYLDIEAIPEFADSLEARILVESHEFQHELARLRSQPLVDYAGVAIAKRKVLDFVYARFRAAHLEKKRCARPRLYRLPPPPGAITAALRPVPRPARASGRQRLDLARLGQLAGGLCQSRCAGHSGLPRRTGRAGGILRIRPVPAGRAVGGCPAGS